MITVYAPCKVLINGRQAVSAAIENEGRHEVYFRVFQGPAATGAATFLFCVLNPAMRLGLPIRVRGAVPPGFLAVADIIQDGMTHWPAKTTECTRVPIEVLPEPGSTQIDAAPAVAAGPDRRGVACFFSGGVDSFDAVLSNNDEITHLIYVHGFDTPLANKAMRRRNAQALRMAAAEMGKTLVEVETNLREFTATQTNWGMPSARSVQVGLSYLLSPQFRKIYIGADCSDYWPGYPEVESARGACVDAGDVQIVFHGRDRLRQEKIAFLSRSEVAMRWLRVCWLNKGTTYNCGQCEKCLRTMIGLHLVGALDRCRTFDRPIELAALRRMVFPSGMAPFWEEIIQALESKGEMALAAEARQRLESVLSAAGNPAELELLKAQARLEELEEERLRMTSSHSWQLTAPLRGVGKLVRELRKTSFGR